MDNKSVLIGTFVKKTKILSFLGYLRDKFKIKLEHVFIYEIEGNDEEYIVTFKSNTKEKYLRYLNYSTVLHVKNGSLFSINALNKLIESETTIEHNKYIVDWDKYKNKLIILVNGELSIKDLHKIEDKSIFFN